MNLNLFAPYDWSRMDGYVCIINYYVQKTKLPKVIFPNAILPKFFIVIVVESSL